MTCSGVGGGRDGRSADGWTGGERRDVLVGLGVVATDFSSFLLWLVSCYSILLKLM